MTPLPKSPHPSVPDPCLDFRDWQAIAQRVKAIGDTEGLTASQTLLHNFISSVCHSVQLNWQLLEMEQNRVGANEIQIAHRAGMLRQSINTLNCLADQIQEWEAE